MAHDKDTMAAEAFPLEVKAVVAASYVDEVALVEQLVEQLQDPLAADVATLHTATWASG